MDVANDIGNLEFGEKLEEAVDSIHRDFIFNGRRNRLRVLSEKYITSKLFPVEDFKTC